MSDQVSDFHVYMNTIIFTFLHLVHTHNENMKLITLDSNLQMIDFTTVHFRLKIVSYSHLIFN